MNNIEKITVYLGSSGRCRDIFKISAQQLGTLIGEQNKTLVYGGMDAGLMGIVANNALSAGAKVIGVIPKKLKDSERIHPNLSETILVPDLWERKLKMFRRADAIINLPGGFGTLDEMMEALHWASIGSHAKPIILVNTEGYWNELIAYLDTLPDLPKEHLIIVNSINDIFPALEKWNKPTVNGSPDNLPHYEDEILNETDKAMIFNTANIKNGYILATALGLKQLDRHQRHIGLLNDQGQFDHLLNWIDTAEKEHFITDRCKQLFSAAATAADLEEKLDNQAEIHIDLSKEKWGPSETSTHIEIKEIE